MRSDSSFASAQNDRQGCISSRRFPSGTRFKQVDTVSYKNLQRVQQQRRSFDEMSLLWGMSNGFFVIRRQRILTLLGLLPEATVLRLTHSLPGTKATGAGRQSVSRCSHRCYINARCVYRSYFFWLIVLCSSSQ